MPSRSLSKANPIIQQIKNRVCKKKRRVGDGGGPGLGVQDHRLSNSKETKVNTVQTTTTKQSTQFTHTNPRANLNSSVNILENNTSVKCMYTNVDGIRNKKYEFSERVNPFCQMLQYGNISTFGAMGINKCLSTFNHFFLY